MQKKLITTSLGLLGLVTIVLFILHLKGSKMRELSSEIEIKASPDAVWAVLSDIENWAEWNPIVLSAHGEASHGATLSITMKSEDDSKGPNYSPVLTTFKKPKTIRWRAKMMAEILFTNDKVLELEATESGTKLVHKEMFKGLLIPVFWGKMKSGVPEMLETMNRALKETVESKS